MLRTRLSNHVTPRVRIQLLTLAAVHSVCVRPTWPRRELASRVKFQACSAPEVSSRDARRHVALRVRLRFVCLTAPPLKAPRPVQRFGARGKGWLLNLRENTAPPHDDIGDAPHPTPPARSPTPCALISNRIGKAEPPRAPRHSPAGRSQFRTPRYTMRVLRVYAVPQGTAGQGIMPFSAFARAPPRVRGAHGADNAARISIHSGS